MMTAAFGHRWTSAHGDDFANTSGRLWAIELAGMTQAQVELGLQVARRSSDGWPPVLADFRAYCLGCLPLIELDANMARPMAEWAPFTVLVQRNIDGHAWRLAGQDGQRHMLQRGYDRARAHVMAGGKLPAYTPASAQIEQAPEHNPLPPIMFSSHDAIEECRRSLGIRDREPEPEPEPVSKKGPEPCLHCGGTRKELDPDPEHPPGLIDCRACFGSGVERSYNLRISADGGITGGTL